MKLKRNNRLTRGMTFGGREWLSNKRSFRQLFRLLVRHCRTCVPRGDGTLESLAIESLELNRNLKNIFFRKTQHIYRFIFVVETARKAYFQWHHLRLTIYCRQPIVGWKSGNRAHGIWIQVVWKQLRLKKRKKMQITFDWINFEWNLPCEGLS